jgi:hypothetical protein
MDSSSSSTAQLCSKEHEIGAYMIAIVAVMLLQSVLFVSLEIVNDGFDMFVQLRNTIKVIIYIR